MRRCTVPRIRWHIRGPCIPFPFFPPPPPPPPPLFLKSAAYPAVDSSVARVTRTLVVRRNGKTNRFIAGSSGPFESRTPCGLSTSPRETRSVAPGLKRRTPGLQQGSTLSTATEHASFAAAHAPGNRRRAREHRERLCDSHASLHRNGSAPRSRRSRRLRLFFFFFFFFFLHGACSAHDDRSPAYGEASPNGMIARPMGRPPR